MHANRQLAQRFNVPYSELPKYLGKRIKTMPSSNKEEKQQKRDTLERTIYQQISLGAILANKF